MALLQNVIKGRQPVPPRLMIYGSEGVGKSTFAANAPKAVFIQTEDGLSEIDCARLPLVGSFEELLTQLKAIRDEEHDYQTLCLDSLDWTERLVWDRVCADYGVKCIEKADGGYGKGYTHALTYWRQIIALLNEIRAKRNMAVVLIARGPGARLLRPLHAASPQGRVFARLRVGGRRPLRHAPDARRLDDGQGCAGRRGRRRTHPPHERLSGLHRQEPLRASDRTRPLVDGVRGVPRQQRNQVTRKGKHNYGNHIVQRG